MGVGGYTADVTVSVAWYPPFGQSLRWRNRHPAVSNKLSSGLAGTAINRLRERSQPGSHHRSMIHSQRPQPVPRPDGSLRIPEHRLRRSRSRRTTSPS
ncbi:hypothetical protein BN381_70115 [Candidatus Microthrix parvicella RN1]|uniref:Uncharacterized protein n=1 Tax=Candidatus Neomicrothrix parvicella RN1 TaxID=1229780 RepID=R4Z6L2_9ACTN|nr:hypothetical protein BN381_70115 [Candidatus Microthrix parvicella RN1]